MVVFEFPTLKLVYNSIQTFAEMYFIFYYVRGWKSVRGFLQSSSIFKNVKLVSFGSIWHFATTTHCNFAFWKIDPPYCTVYSVCNTFILRNMVKCYGVKSYKNKRAIMVFLPCMQCLFWLSSTRIRIENVTFKITHLCTVQ